MSDLDAIRARHVPGRCIIPGHTHAACQSDRTDWPCDTAIVLAALDGERKAHDTAIWEEGTNRAALDAALARERRLREAAQETVESWEAVGSDSPDATVEVFHGRYKRLLAALAETPERHALFVEPDGTVHDPGKDTIADYDYTDEGLGGT